MAPFGFHVGKAQFIPQRVSNKELTPLAIHFQASSLLSEPATTHRLLPVTA